MIKFKLFCKNCSQDFDSWFASSKKFEKLKKSKLLNCPSCNSYKIDKSIMSPSIINNKNEVIHVHSHMPPEFNPKQSSAVEISVDEKHTFVFEN